MTTGVKAPFGAVRNLYTPVGGTRVLDLADLLTGKTYVASGGARTKFQKIEYGAKPRPRRARSQVRSYPRTTDKPIFETGKIEKLEVGDFYMAQNCKQDQFSPFNHFL